MWSLYIQALPLLNAQKNNVDAVIIKINCGNTQVQRLLLKVQ